MNDKWIINAVGKNTNYYQPSMIVTITLTIQIKVEPKYQIRQLQFYQLKYYYTYRRFRKIMTSSQAENKQNYQSQLLQKINNQKHQGRAFKIDIGQHNGPFLSKDLMFSNQKSTYLIAAKNILQTHMSMSNLMGTFIKQAQKQSSIIKNSSKIQNYYSKCLFLQGQLQYIQKQSNKLLEQQKKLKLQIKNTYHYFIKFNDQINNQFIILFKNLLKNIKKQHHQQINVFQSYQRQIQQFGTFRNHYLDGLVNSQSAILKIQDCLGDNDSINSPALL